MKNMSLDTLATGALLILAMTVAVPASLAQNKATQKVAQQNPAVEKKSNPAGHETNGRPQEGIKVHGHWVIVIREKDGREVDRREFENGLEPDGQQQLASLLSRSQAISDWAILLFNNGPGGQPCANNHECGISERQSSRLPFADVDYVVGLTVKYDAAIPTRLQLLGTRRVTSDGIITGVESLLGLCPAGPPSATGCVDSQTFLPFTSKIFGSVSVISGQSVDVTVTFTFN